MNEQIKIHIKKFSEEIKDMFSNLRQLIFDSTSAEIDEVLWARLPSYNVGDKFVRLIPFGDHINVEATAILNHKDELSAFKITPKGMLQIFVKQEIPSEILLQIFKETLGK